MRTDARAMPVIAGRQPRLARTVRDSSARALRSRARRLEQALRRDLFVPTQLVPRTWARWALAVAAVVVGTGTSLLRTRGPGAFNTIWAEDGSHFLNDALNLPTRQTLFKGLNGYFVLLPRLIAEPTTVLPLEWAPAVLSTGAALTTALFALAVYVASGAHLSHPLLRLLVAAPVVVTPVGAHTTPNNVATLQFVALYAAFWMLIWVPATRVGRAGALTIVVLTGLSTILAALLMPLAVLRLVVRRDRWSVVLAAATAAASATQVAALATGVVSRGDLSRPDFDPVWAFVEYLLWGLPYSVLGEQWLEPPANGFNGIYNPEPPVDMWMHAGLIALAYLTVIAVIVLAVRRFTQPAWPLAVVAGAYSVMILSAEMMAMGYQRQAYLVPEIFLIGTERYLVPATLLVITSIVALLRFRAATAADGPDAAGAGPPPATDEGPHVTVPAAPSAAATIARPRAAATIAPPRTAPPRTAAPRPAPPAAATGLRERLRADRWTLPGNAWPAVAYGTLILIIMIANLRVDNPRVWTRPWSQVVNEARAECAATGARTAPAHYGGGHWYPWVNVPCRKI